MTVYYHPDDLPPQDRALAEHLRKRCAAMGCVCRPAVTVDHALKRVAVEHHYGCPALGHPAADASAN